MAVAADFLTPAEIVKRHPWVSRSTLYGAMKAGFLPHYRVPSKRGARGKYLLKESEFLAWVESTRQVAAGAPAPPATPRLRHLTLD